MEQRFAQPQIAPAIEHTAFAVWLGKTLRSCHQDTVNEPIPAELLDLLPPSTKQR